MGKISGSHCLVLGCRNRQLLNQTNTRSYFRFPRDAELCKKWVDFCNRPELYKKYDENGPEYLYKSSRICSDHFQPTDFNNPNLFSQGLKKGSIPTVNPASNEAKANNGTAAAIGASIGGGGGGGGGGSGSSNGAGSPIDEKLLSAVAAMPNLPANLSLMVAAAVAAAQSQHQQQQQQQATNLKRTAAAMNASTGASALQLTSPTNASATSPTGTPVPLTTSTSSSSSTSSSAKRNRAVPPLATPTGALANLIQRHQQIKEQQRKAAVLAATGLVNGQVSITATSLASSRTSPNNGASARPLALLTAKKASANNHNNNNNNNNVSNHNHNHSGGGGKTKEEKGSHNHNEYGINMIDMDMTGGESSEGDSSYQNSADEEYSYHQQQKVARVEAVIPPSLKSQLTVTPASSTPATANTTSTTTTTNSSSAASGTTINNNTIHNLSTNGGGPTNGNINYKEKYEQTLKELFACRKIVKNQNKAIKQLQGEIDFLNQLLKEK